MSDNDEQLPLSENAFHVSDVAVIPTADHPSRKQLPSEDSDLVIRISVKDSPHASPFHFWIDEQKARGLTVQMAEYFGPLDVRSRQIFLFLERVEDRLERIEDKLKNLT